MAFTHIIWDWNGTLLDDAWLCREAINTLLRRRHRPELDSERYQEIFTFPLYDYYRQAGFDFDRDDWNAVAVEFMEEYHRRLPECRLHGDVPALLDHFDQAGIHQALLSAYRHDWLLTALETYGVRRRFQWVRGVDGIHAEGKAERGRHLAAEMNCPPATTLMIGDTLQDAEVARHLGMPCILIQRGNQNHARLGQAGVPVFDSLSHALEAYVLHGDSA